jgi:hypothetical protein
MLESMLTRIRFRATPPDFATSTRPSLFPQETDEVRELNRTMKKSIDDVLRQFGHEPQEIEIRRRISTKEYRAYISLKSDATLASLEVVEDIVRSAIHDSMRIEISDLHWRRYRPSS